MNQPEAVIKSWPLPRGGVGGGPFSTPRYHRVVRAYFDNVAAEGAL